MGHKVLLAPPATPIAHSMVCTIYEFDNCFKIVVVKNDCRNIEQLLRNSFKLQFEYITVKHENYKIKINENSKLLNLNL